MVRSFRQDFAYERMTGYRGPFDFSKTTPFRRPSHDTHEALPLGFPEYAEAFATRLRSHGSRAHLYVILRDLLVGIPSDAVAMDWAPAPVT